LCPAPRGLHVAAGPDRAARARCDRAQFGGELDFPDLPVPAVKGILVKDFTELVVGN
jgi:hypothetical protein